VSSADLIAQLEALGVEFSQVIDELSDEQGIRSIQAQYLGKKGSVSALMREMKTLDPAERKAVGAEFNRVKNQIAGLVESKLERVAEAVREADLRRQIDVTLPGRRPPLGHAHLLTQVRDVSVEIFSELGFEVAMGRRSRPIFTALRRWQFRKIIPLATCKTLFISTTKLFCAHIPRPCRFERWRKPPRLCELWHPAWCIGGMMIPRTAPCSLRSRACSSTKK